MHNQSSPRFCRVNDSLTSDQFGCEPHYFDKYIKDQNLLITFDYINVLQIQDATGETWGIDKDDVTELTKEEAAA